MTFEKCRQSLHFRTTKMTKSLNRVHIQIGKINRKHLSNSSKSSSYLKYHGQSSVKIDNYKDLFTNGWVFI